MIDLDRAAARVARRQLGLVTTEQAREVGFTPAQIRARRAGGRWTVVAPGVSAIEGVDITWRTRVMAACLATGGVASHRTAAALHGVAGFGPPGPGGESGPSGPQSGDFGVVEVTAARGAPGSQLVIPGVTVHRSLDLDRVPTVRVERIPTTAAQRLVVDLGGVVPQCVYTRAFDDLINRGLITWDDAFDALFAHARRGRRGVGALRSLLVGRYGDDPPDGVLVPAFLRLLSSAGLPRPEGPVAIADARGPVASVDFAYPGQRVAVRLGAFPGGEDGPAGDPDRRARLEAVGWRVMVFSGRVIIERPQFVVAAVRRSLAAW